MRYIIEENPYIWCRFTTGDSVTITIYKASDDSVIVNAVAMSELASTGFFKYQFNPSPSALTEYFYIATNTIEEHAGKIILGGYPDGIKDQSDKMNFVGTDIKATLDSEEVTTDSASRNASKADVSALATSSALSSHDTKLDTVDGIVDRILKATEIKQCVVTDASATSLSFTTDLSETSNQFWSRGVILITSGNNEGQMRAILNYNGSTKAITLKTPLDAAPAQNDTFIILTERKYLTPDIEDIISAVWDEPIADHTDILKFGGKNQKAVPSETIDDYKADVSNLDTTVSSRSSHADPTNGIKGSPGKTNQEVFDNEKGTDGAYTGTPPTPEEIKTKIEEAGSKVSNIKTETDKLNFSGDNVQARVADKGVLNNPPSESIADYKDKMSEGELHTGLDNYTGKDGYKAIVSDLAKEAGGNLETIKDEVQNVVYGLSALKDIFDAIKGVGWSNETLKAVYDYAKSVEERLTSTRAGYLDKLNISGDIQTDIIDKIANVTYGLSALQGLLDAIDTSTELEARFTEIKGTGWTVETLKAIKSAIDSAGIKDWTADELKQIRDALGVDGDKITAVSGQLQSVKTAVEFVENIWGGRWKIDQTAKQMIFYKSDNTTEIARFDLKDKDGVLAIAEVVERVRK